ncbi:MAG: hypothetical protein AB8H47_10870 [Bacteroidia bacterium]
MENAQNFETFVSEHLNSYSAQAKAEGNQDLENRPPSKFKVTITNVVLGDPHLDFEMVFTPSVDDVYPGNTAIQNMKIEIYVSLQNDSNGGLAKTITKFSAINESDPDSPILGSPMDSNSIPFQNQILDLSLPGDDFDNIIGIRMVLSGDDASFYGDGILEGSFYASVPYSPNE